MFIVLVSSLFLFMVYFVNTFYYVFVLLFSVLCFLLVLVTSSMVSSLFAIAISFIYVGAVIVFIGYVCAVVPNPIFNTNANTLLCFLVSGGLVFSLPSVVWAGGETSSLGLFDFFYLNSSASVFFLVILFLLLVLLGVSSHHIASSGPFRAV